MVGRFDHADVDAIQCTGCGSDCDCVVCVDLNNAVWAFVDGFGFVAGGEIGQEINFFIDDIVVSNSFVVGSKEAVINVCATNIV